jgi:hypothetical protein
LIVVCPKYPILKFDDQNQTGEKKELFYFQCKPSSLVHVLSLEAVDDTSLYSGANPAVGRVGLQPPYCWKPHRAPPKLLQQFVIMDEEEEKEKREEEEEKEEEERMGRRAPPYL